MMFDAEFLRNQMTNEILFSPNKTTSIFPRIKSHLCLPCFILFHHISSRHHSINSFLIWPNEFIFQTHAMWKRSHALVKNLLSPKKFSRKNEKDEKTPAPRMGFFMPEICEIKSFLTRCHNFSFLFSRGTKNTRERDKNVIEVAFNKILQLMKNFQGLRLKIFVRTSNLF